MMSIKRPRHNEGYVRNTDAAWKLPRVPYSSWYHLDSVADIAKYLLEHQDEPKPQWENVKGVLFDDDPEVPPRLIFDEESVVEQSQSQIQQQTAKKYKPDPDDLWYRDLDVMPDDAVAEALAYYNRNKPAETTIFPPVSRPGPPASRVPIPQDDKPRSSSSKPVPRAYPQGPNLFSRQFAASSHAQSTPHGRFKPEPLQPQPAFPALRPEPLLASDGRPVVHPATLGLASNVPDTDKPGGEYDIDEDRLNLQLRLWKDNRATHINSTVTLRDIFIPKEIKPNVLVPLFDILYPMKYVEGHHVRLVVLFCKQCKYTDAELAMLADSIGIKFKPKVHSSQKATHIMHRLKEMYDIAVQRGYIWSVKGDVPPRAE